MDYKGEYCYHSVPLEDPVASDGNELCGQGRDCWSNPKFASVGGRMTVSISRLENIAVVTIDRSQHRNAVDHATAQQLANAFRSFDADSALDVAILTGAGGHFWAGADLKALPNRVRRPI